MRRYQDLTSQKTCTYTSVSQPFSLGGSPKIIFHIPRNPYESISRYENKKTVARTWRFPQYWTKLFAYFREIFGIFRVTLNVSAFIPRFLAELITILHGTLGSKKPCFGNTDFYTVYQTVRRHAKNNHNRDTPDVRTPVSRDSCFSFPEETLFCLHKVVDYFGLKEG